MVIEEVAGHEKPTDRRPVGLTATQKQTASEIIQCPTSYRQRGLLINTLAPTKDLDCSVINDFLVLLAARMVKAGVEVWAVDSTLLNRSEPVTGAMLLRWLNRSRKKLPRRSLLDCQLVLTAVNTATPASTTEGANRKNIQKGHWKLVAMWPNPPWNDTKITVVACLDTCNKNNGDPELSGQQRSEVSSRPLCATS